jgi:hypothetical protein
MREPLTNEVGKNKRSIEKRAHCVGVHVFIHFFIQFSFNSIIIKDLLI